MGSSKTDEAEGDTIDVEKLISEIQYNGRVIWDKRLSGHANKSELSAAWDKVIENIGLDPKDKKNSAECSKVRSRWTVIKNRFTTETKKEPKLKSGSAPQTFTSKFEHYHRLLFLKETLKPAKSTGTYTELVEAAKAKEAAEVKVNEETGSESGKDKEDEEETSSDIDEVDVIEKEEVISVDKESLTLDQEEDKNKESCFDMAETTKSKSKSKQKADTAPSDDSCNDQNKSDKTHLYVPQDEHMLFFSHLHRTMLRLPAATTFKLRKKFMQITDDTMDNNDGPEVIVVDDDDDTCVKPTKHPKVTRRHHPYVPVQIRKEKVESDLDAGYQHAPPSGAQNPGTGYYRVNPSSTELHKNTQELNQNQSQYAWRVPAQHSQYSQASATVPQTPDQPFFYQPPPPPPASNGQFYDTRTTAIPSLLAPPYYRSDPAQLPFRVGCTAPANFERYPGRAVPHPMGIHLAT